MMRTTFGKFFALVLAATISASTANAGVYEDCSPCAPCDPCTPVCKKKSKLKIGGWLEASYYRNAWGQEVSYEYDANRNRNTILGTSGNTEALGNMNTTDPQVNQVVLFVEREMDTSRGFDWGFRVESGFGTDMISAQAWNDQTFDWNAGEGDYNWALSAVYATVGYKDLTVKIGKFGTLMGYEAFQSTGKFFVSHAYQYNIEPLSTTGILAEYALGDHVTLLAGYSMGNDNWENQFGDSQIIGGVTADLTDRLSLSYMFNVGYEYDGTYKSGGPRTGYNQLGSFGSGRSDNYYQTFVINYQLTDRLAYALYSNYFNSESKGLGYGKSYGVANYLTYQLSDKWEAGFRFEWMRSEVRAGDSSGNDFYEYTLGLKWSPLKHLTVLGEVRYDQAYQDEGGHNNIFDNEQHAEQFSGGISAIIAF